MKTSLTILTLMALTLAASVVYADDLPYMAAKDTGTEIYESAFGRPGDEGILCAKDFGVALYRDAFPGHDVMVKRAEGSAAGGLCPEEKITEGPNAVIWDNLMGSIGGSDLP